MTPLQKGDLVYTRHGHRARVLHAYCDNTVAIAREEDDRVLHVDRRWVFPLEESFARERAEAIEMVALLCGGVLAGVITALVCLL